MPKRVSSRSSWGLLVRDSSPAWHTMSAVGKRYGVPVLAVPAVLLATATESGSHALAAVETRKISGFVGRCIAHQLMLRLASVAHATRRPGVVPCPLN
eukprot:scaffold28009_cov55-Phaeocystis_antarctica.AAC.2